MTSTPESILSVQRRCDTRMPARILPRRSPDASSRPTIFVDAQIGALADHEGQRFELGVAQGVDRRAVGGDDRNGAVLLPQAVGAGARRLRSPGGRGRVCARCTFLTSGRASSLRRISSTSRNGSDWRASTPAAFRICASVSSTCPAMVTASTPKPSARAARSRGRPNSRVKSPYWPPAETPR